jgi:sugar lactone lactonase YvrE
MVADDKGTLYLVDSTASTIRAISASGQVTTFAGKTGVSGYKDGPATEALFNNPSYIARDRSGNLFITDTASSVIRKITPDGVVSTLAGTPGVRGNADGVGTAARFSTPTGIAIDAKGNLLVTDGWVNTIRKITPSGKVTTWANKTGLRGATDGPVDQARFIVPAGIAVDRAGNVYVCDYGNRTIRKITPNGIVSTLAGRLLSSAPTLSDRGPRSIDGVGSRAEFYSPLAITVDDAGNLYVADAMTIRKVTPGGAVTTIAGVAQQEGIKLGRLPARLENTSALAFIDAHTLAVAQRFSVLKILLDDR